MEVVVLVWMDPSMRALYHLIANDTTALWCIAVGTIMGAFFIMAHSSYRTIFNSGLQALGHG